MGVFARTVAGLAAEADAPKTVMIDATHLKAHRTASSLRSKKGRLVGCTRGGLSTKLHAGTNAEGRPIRLLLSAGQVSDYTGALALLDTLPGADWLLADRGHDADWFREASADRGLKPCIPGRSLRGTPIKHNRRRCKRRHRIEMMFGRLKDWRRVATRLTTAAPRSSSQPSPWPPPSCSGHEPRA